MFYSSVFFLVQRSIAKAFGIKRAPFWFGVGITQASSHGKVTGLCQVNLKLLG